MPIRRTTLAAEADDLALLEAEARRQGASLAHVLRLIVAREAERLRAEHRPRFGIVHSGAGVARMSVEDEDAPARGRLVT